MLPEPLRLLIAAYAADDLSPRRRKAAVRLLKHSREARHLLRALVADRKRVRSLPQQALPGDFAERVLARLPARSPVVRPSAPPVRNFAPAHVAAAFAVAVALGVGGWTVLAFNGDGRRGTTPALVVRPKVDAPAVVVLPEPTNSGDNGVELKASGDIPPADLMPEAKPVPTPKSPPRDVLTAPATPKLETVQVKPPRLTLVLPAQTLESADGRAQLARDFGRGDAHRVDLFGSDTPRGFDRLQAALSDKGVRVSVEAVAAEAHKRHTRGQTYVLFCEDLTALEWAELLHHLGVIDRRAEARKAGDGLFEAIALMPLVPSDQKDLTALFGADVSQPVVKAKPAVIDVRKPLADATAQQVLEALDKPGRDRKPGDKAAIVLSGSALRASPATSREIKQFLDGRRERPAGGVAVMLVLRQATS